MRGAVSSTFQLVMPVITQLSSLRHLKLCGSRFEVKGDGLGNLDAIAGLSALQVCPDSKPHNLRLYSTPPISGRVGRGADMLLTGFHPFWDTILSQNLQAVAAKDVT
jgi:hypothetical protein